VLSAYVIDTIYPEEGKKAAEEPENSEITEDPQTTEE